MSIENPKYKDFVFEYAHYLVTEGYTSFHPDCIRRVVHIYDVYCRGLIGTGEAMQLLTAIENPNQKGVVII